MNTSVAPLAERYEILEELGRGGMGVVYRARDRDTGDVVALKVLRSEIADRPELIERFKAELLLARKITHKNVCRVHDLNRFGNVAAISMEYIEGESLRSLLKRVPGFSVRHGLNVARQIIAALAEAHAQGVVHRDLKPENILIAHDGTVKVMDFGIARSLESETTQTTTISGTPAYMSPEQAQGKPADARSDIYSLGLVLYEMFTGNPAFHADTPVAVAMKHIHEAPPAPRDTDPYLPDFIERAICKCLEKDPKRRFAAVAELAKSLEEREAPVAATAPVPLPVHLSAPRRSDAALFCLGILGLAAFLFAAADVIPEVSLRLRYTKRMIEERASEEITRRGMRDSKLFPGYLSSWTEPYSFIAQEQGFQEARKCLAESQTCSPYYYVFSFNAPGNASGWFHYNLDGSLRSFSLPVVSIVPPGSIATADTAQSLVVKNLQDTSGVNLFAVRPQSVSEIIVEGRRGYYFRWSVPGPGGSTWTYTATAFDRPVYSYRGFDLPEGYKPATALYDNRYGLVFFGAFTFLVFLGRRVFLDLQLRQVVALTVFGLATGVLPFVSALFVVLMINALAFVGTAIVAAPTLSFLARRRWPHLVASFDALTQVRPLARETALACLRGTACGLAIVGARTLVWNEMVRFRMTWPSLNPFTYFTLNSPFPALSVAVFALLVACAAGTILTLIMVLLRRWIPSKGLLALAAAVAWTATMNSTSFGQIRGEFLPIAVTFATVTVFAWVLAEFDLLTVLVTVFCYHSALFLYPAIKMYEPIGNGQFWLVVAAWGAILAWALIIAYLPLWTRVGRRVTAALE